MPTRGAPPRDGVTKLHPDSVPQLRQVYIHIHIVDVRRCYLYICIYICI